MAFSYVPRLTDEGMRTSRFYSVMPSKWGSIQPLNNFLNNPYHKGNCTSYCIGRWLEICNGDISKMEGLLSTRFTDTWDGGAWYVCSPSLQAGKTNPQPGDIACWSRGLDSYKGHVAVVEQVFHDYCVMSQSEYNGKYFNKTDNYKVNDYMGKWYKDRGYVFRGFIRMKDIPHTAYGPDFNMPTEWVNTIDYFIPEGSDAEYNNMVMAYVALYHADINWTLEAICGVLGNMWRESHLNPGMREIGNHNNGGLVGWTPLTKWSIEANFRGIPWNDGDGQCDWVSGGEYWADPDHDGIYTLYQNHWVPARMTTPMTYDEYKKCTDSPEECATHFMQGYEGPGVPAEAERRRKAREYYDYLLGLNITTPTFPIDQPYKDGLKVWQMAGNAKPKLIY